jgi:ABC-2 type transport system ATP-binding protein
MEAILTEDLTKRFDDLIAVDRFSVKVAQGELFGLVGSDGAGKTTIMRMLAGIMDPTEGAAWVQGHHTVQEPDAIKEEIGYMSQKFGLYPDLTVMENIEFYADIYGIPRNGRKKKFDSLLAFSNLTPFQRRHAGDLSGGMKQKLGLTCALVHTPRVLFLDEPTNGVDPLSRREFWRILYQLLKDGVTIFVTTAYLDEADRCNRVGLIHRGKLLACDTPYRLRALMKGQILELQTSNSRHAIRLLKDHLPMASLGLFGDRVHLVTTDPGQVQPQVEAILGSGDIDILTIRLIEPNLEDIFLSVMGSEEGRNIVKI